MNIHAQAVLALLVATTSVMCIESATAASTTNVLLSPNQGPVGTIVHVSGRLSADDRALYGTHPMYRLYADVSRTCELNVDFGPAHLIVDTSSGVVQGSFVVLGTGSCTTSSTTPQRVRPGQYQFAIGCQACTDATFNITSGSTLPFTGLPILTLVAAGLALTIAGAMSVGVSRFARAIGTS